MEKNIFANLCSGDNYKLINTMVGTTFFSSLSLAMNENLILQHYPNLDKPIKVLEYSFFTTCLLLSMYRISYKPKEEAEIKELYKEFINNYGELNTIFDLKNPIEIYTLFVYLLKKGYLSKNQSFEFSKRIRVELEGANVITGKATCRHISAMLTDILKQSDIKSSQMLGYYGEKVKNINKKLFPNHAITFATKDNINYFLDPTNRRIFRYCESTKDFLYNYDHVGYIQMFPYIKYRECNINLMKENLNNNNQNVSREEEISMYKNTIEMCKNNNDIFETFYNQNEELYDDISNKILKIKY